MLGGTIWKILITIIGTITHNNQIVQVIIQKQLRLKTQKKYQGASTNRAKILTLFGQLKRR